MRALYLVLYQKVHKVYRVEEVEEEKRKKKNLKPSQDPNWRNLYIARDMS